MIVELELDGRRCQVTLRRDGDHWLAAIDGREVAVSVVEDGSAGRTERWSMLVGWKSYDVEIEARAGGELLVHVNGVAVPVVINRPGPPRAARRGRRGSGDTGGDTQPTTIVAPMPGRIVRVLVQPGEDVQARQGLVVVEAMKMENELRAPRSGTIAEVRVTEGSSVEANAVLVVLR